MMVVKKMFLVLFLAVAAGACSKSENYEPDAYLSQEEQQIILRKILPYFAKPQKSYSYEKRFDAILDSFYINEIKKYNIQHYYIADDSVHYFMVNRPAPSIYEKRISIAGKFKKDSKGNILDYEELFWTFKMKKEDLNKKGAILFSEMVKGGDLSQYTPGKKTDEWIEFPDDNCSYDKQEKRWKMASDSQLFN